MLTKREISIVLLSSCFLSFTALSAEEEGGEGSGRSVSPVGDRPLIPEEVKLAMQRVQREMVYQSVTAMKFVYGCGSRYEAVDSQISRFVHSDAQQFFRDDMDEEDRSLIIKAIGNTWFSQWQKVMPILKRLIRADTSASTISSIIYSFNELSPKKSDKVARYLLDLMPLGVDIHSVSHLVLVLESISEDSWPQILFYLKDLGVEWVLEQSFCEVIMNVRHVSKERWPTHKKILLEIEEKRRKLLVEFREGIMVPKK